ncbi:MAG: hypothetical protein JRJ29_18070 [Deltaproteobacteria bacterium]|nr:hypothetical protein [Deltaproteobacteria bacterium]
MNSNYLIKDTDIYSGTEGGRVIKDYVFRIKETDDGLTVYVTKTEAFGRRLYDLVFRVKVLRDVLRRLWRSNRYHQEYSNLLLGRYSQEEFLAIAEKYVSDFRTNVSKGQLAAEASIVLDAVQETITSGDLSQLLDVDPAMIEEALRQCPYVERDRGTED